MTPRFSIAYSETLASGNIEGFCQFSYYNSVRPCLSYFNYFIKRYLGASIFLSSPFPSNLCASVSFAFCVSSFLNHVIDVIAARSSPKMVWVYAARVVAFMKNPKAFWNFLIIVNLPRISMRPNIAFCWAKKSISFSVLSSSPNPTLSNLRNMFWNRPIFINLLPKSLFGWFSSLKHSIYHKQKIHHSAKVMSAQIVPQSPNGESNLFGSSAFSSHIKAACIIA